MVKQDKKSTSVFVNGTTNLFNYLHNQITALNQSKYFAGIMIIIINVASKFMTIKLSKTLESYIRYSFSRDILVFAITWMGTRDIYTAIVLTIIFIILADFIFNEESTFCCLPETFVDYHANLTDPNTKKINPDEIKKVQDILDKAKVENHDEHNMGEKPRTESVNNPIMQSNISGY